MSYTFEITEYEIGIPKKYYDLIDAIAHIRCNTAEGHILVIGFYPPYLAWQKGNFFLYFFIPGQPPPPPPDTYVAFLSLSAEKYVWVLDLLRNEKPVYVYLNPGAPEHIRIFKP